MTVRKRATKKVAKKQAPSRGSGSKAKAKAKTKVKKDEGDGTEFSAFLKDVQSKKSAGIILPSRTIRLANHVPTGAFALDYGLLGGIPEGFNTMMYGYDSSGKSLMAMKAVAGMQRKKPNGIAVWIDTEQLFDAKWAEMNGIDLDRLWVVNPDSGNEAVDMVHASMQPLEVEMVVLDSIPACVPEAVEEKSASDKTMAELARLMGIMCSKVITNWAKERKRNHYVTFIDINQWRGKPGVMFGATRDLAGGRQINHIPTTKISLGNKQEMGKDRYGAPTPDFNTHSFKFEKTKHGSSIKEGEFVMNLNPDNPLGLKTCEFDDFGTVTAFAKRIGLITGGGASWYCKYYSENKFGRLSEITDELMNDEDFYYSLRASVIAGQRVSKELPATPPDGYLERKGAHIPKDLKTLIGL